MHRSLSIRCANVRCQVTSLDPSHTPHAPTELPTTPPTAQSPAGGSRGAYRHAGPSWGAAWSASLPSGGPPAASSARAPIGGSPPMVIAGSRNFRNFPQDSSEFEPAGGEHKRQSAFFNINRPVFFDAISAQVAWMVVFFPPLSPHPRRPRFPRSFEPPYRRGEEIEAY